MPKADPTKPSEQVKKTEILQDLLYEMTADRFASMADSEHLVGEAELTLAELESFIDLAVLKPAKDPDIWYADLVAQLPVQGPSPEKLRASAISILNALEALISGYAIIWAKCKAAEMSVTTSSPQGSRTDPLDPQQLLAEMDDSKSERVKLLLQRPTGNFQGTSKDGSVTAICRRKCDHFDGLTLAMGGSNFNMNVMGIKPFRRHLLSASEYRQKVLEAINDATKGCRSMFGTERTMQEVDAEDDQERVRIDEQLPKFWGCQGVGAILCGLGACLFDSKELEDPDFENPFRWTEDSTEMETRHFLETGRDEFTSLLRRLEIAREASTPPTQDTLREFASIRQFFLCSLGNPGESFPDEVVDLAQEVYLAIEREVKLERTCRDTNLQMRTRQWRTARRLATISEQIFEVSSKHGNVRVSGSGRLESLEIHGKRTSKRNLMALLNSAFERCSKEHRLASVILDLD